VSQGGGNGEFRRVAGAEKSGVATLRSDPSLIAVLLRLGRRGILLNMLVERILARNKEKTGERGNWVLFTLYEQFLVRLVRGAVASAGGGDFFCAAGACG